MHLEAASAEEILIAASEAVRAGEAAMAAALDALPSPVYVTDKDGRVTYCNKACAAFAGRSPVVGEDRWCVTWKLFTLDGRFLPHEECPMAVAIRSREQVRGVQAIAERPDGTRRRFMPYPTPLLDAEGELIGAINMLVDITDTAIEADRLKAQAHKCRRLAKSINDPQTAYTLKLMAGEYEARVQELERPN